MSLHTSILVKPPRWARAALRGPEFDARLPLLFSGGDAAHQTLASRLLAAAVKRIKNGKIYLIPASTGTRGHLTTGDAKFYKQQLEDLLKSAPARAM